MSTVPTFVDVYQYDTNSSRKRRPWLVRRFNLACSILVRVVRRRRLTRANLLALEGLDDRQLRDIGLQRSDIWVYGRLR